MHYMYYVPGALHGADYTYDVITRRACIGKASPAGPLCFNTDTELLKESGSYRAQAVPRNIFQIYAQASNIFISSLNPSSLNPV